MRVPNDRLLAKHSKGVDLFLGGHDHIYHLEQTGDQQNLFIKSGCDFKTFSLIKCLVYPAGSNPSTMDKEIMKLDSPVNDAIAKPYPHTYNYVVRENLHVEVTRYEIRKDIAPDEEISQYMNECYRELDLMMQQVKLDFHLQDVLYIEEPLNTLFEHVRTQESAIGNFAADLMRKEHCADVAIFCGGGIRADKIYPQGFLKYEAYSEMFPFPNPVMLVEATGEEILLALENGVSKVPALDGRYPQVSGIKFTYDPNKPPMQRILIESVRLDDGPINLTKKYRLAIPKYIASGKDGYDVLINCRKIVDLIVAPIFKDLFEDFVNFIQNKKTFEEYKLWSKHQDSFVKGRILDVSLQTRLQEEARARLLMKEGSKKQRMFFKPLQTRRRSEGQIKIKELSMDFAIGVHSHHQKSLFGEEGKPKFPTDNSKDELEIQEFTLKPTSSVFEPEVPLETTISTSVDQARGVSEIISGSSGQGVSPNPSAGQLPELVDQQFPPQVIDESDSEEDADSSKPSTKYFKIEDAIPESSQEQIKEGHAMLGAVLLKRLRKYRLISGTVERQEARQSQTKHLAKLSLKVEGRITSIPLAVQSASTL
jgi:5'-nucleotidase, C-terminal domain